jgi:FAD:protein FMN transferase
VITRGAPDGWTLVARFEPVMGTHLEMQITAGTEREARQAQATALAETARLEALFTVFDPSSELRRWRGGELDRPGPELTWLLARAAKWQATSDGTFNPVAGVLTRLWLQAVDDGALPSSAELADQAASIAAPRFGVVEGAAVRLGDCTDVDLNAIAKGHVVDLVAQRLLTDHHLSRLVLNAGGDLVHHGAGTLRVAVEDPRQPYDNAPPLTRIEISGAAVATSGRARRWFEVGGVRHSRVLDPRTGQPVTHTASATVIAPDATTADVLATTASVLPPHDTIRLMERMHSEHHPAAALVIGRDGSEHRSQAWPPEV